MNPPRLLPHIKRLFLADQVVLRWQLVQLIQQGGVMISSPAVALQTIVQLFA